MRTKIRSGHHRPPRPHQKNNNNNKRTSKQRSATMDSWIVGQISFWYTVREVNPAEIVDQIINFWLDMVTPGRGAGESQWWQRAVRTLEQTSERASREMDIRRDLRIWDQDHPEIHHELIVRYVCGAAISVVATAFYNSIKRGHRKSSQRNDY
mmetsp:Transcript_15273/g.42314  ORF Transcript_15273/g.42314 Transcript_15273/m.42314 type:complete len:153 (+) Transcript_15273:307-765(+)